MQAQAGQDALALARSRARKWLRIFQQLVRVLDRLEQRTDSLLASALVFLVQRALGQLETGDAATAHAVAPRGVELEEEESSGAQLVAAIDLARHARDRRDLREDPATDTLEVLLVLAGSLTESQDEGSYGDAGVTVDDLVAQYRGIKQASSQDVTNVPLFPAAFRKRWSALLEAAAQKEDPLRRLALELSVMKVIHALYALAIGYRGASSFDKPDPDTDSWLAYSLGEATLKSARRA